MVVVYGGFIALDIGDRMIGYANFGSSSSRVVDRGVFKGGGKKQLLKTTRGHIAESGVKRVVVGMPFHTETGEITAQGAKIITFTQLLISEDLIENSSSFQIYCVDESFTSREAVEVLGAHQKKKRQHEKGKGNIDASAAEAIGKRYLEGEPSYKIYTLEECAAMLDSSSSN